MVLNPFASLIKDNVQTDHTVYAQINKFILSVAGNNLTTICSKDNYTFERFSGPSHYIYKYVLLLFKKYLATQ